jgi:DNA adenine methylase
LSKQILKYIGNKHRYANEIISYFPKKFKSYYEPFLGSAAILYHLNPKKGFGSDLNNNIIDFFKTLQNKPNKLAVEYKKRWELFNKDRKEAYTLIKNDFNKNNNPYDFFFLSRSCYGGVLRYRKDGFFSTPIGPHKPVSPDEIKIRILDWNNRIKKINFDCCDYSKTILKAGDGDIVYCDPPYFDSQKIIYGAQNFSYEAMLEKLLFVKKKGAFIALSMDGSKKSGKKIINLNIPKKLFKTEFSINLKGSMLKRFQRKNEDVKDEFVTDRLLVSH